MSCVSRFSMSGSATATSMREPSRWVGNAPRRRASSSGSSATTSGSISARLRSTTSSPSCSASTSVSARSSSRSELDEEVAETLARRGLLRQRVVAAGPRRRGRGRRAARRAGGRWARATISSFDFGFARRRRRSSAGARRAAAASASTTAVSGGGAGTGGAGDRRRDAIGSGGAGGRRGAAADGAGAAAPVRRQVVSPPAARVAGRSRAAAPCVRARRVRRSLLARQGRVAFGRVACRSRSGRRGVALVGARSSAALDHRSVRERVVPRDGGASGSAASARPPVARDRIDRVRAPHSRTLALRVGSFRPRTDASRVFAACSARTGPSQS